MGDVEMRSPKAGQIGLSVRSFVESDLISRNAYRLTEQSPQGGAGHREQGPVLGVAEPVCPIPFGGGEDAP